MSTIGIDIGSKAIKVIEIDWEGGQPVLKGAGILGIKDASVDRLQNDAEYTELAGSVRKLMSDTKINGKDVAISLPESLVFTRSLKLPPLTDEEIASAVKWQAEDIVPIPIKDAIVQHTIIERRETQPPQAIVLVVAAPRILVEKYIKLFSLAGLSVVSVETELIALARSIGNQTQTVLIVDFGAKSTDIAVAKNGKLLFSRSIPTAGDALTRSVSQAMNITAPQAEEYKRTYGLATTQLEGKVAAAILPIFRIIAEEIKKAIHFYKTDENGEDPALIVLTGGGAQMPEIATNLTKMIGIEVTIANPFSKVKVNPEVAKNLGNYAPLYSIAVGLALKEE